MTPSPNHPTLDELITYHEGNLGEEETERLQEHLASCAECAAYLLDLHNFAAAGGEIEATDGAGASPITSPADLEAVAFWQRLRRRLPAARRWPWARGWVIVAAASLMLAVGLSLWRSSATSGKVETLDLGRLDGERAGETSRTLPVAAKTVRLVGSVVGLAPGTRLRGWLEHSSGERVWEGATEVSAAEKVEIVVPTRRLKAGGYQLHLEGEGVAPLRAFFLLDHP